MKRAIIVGATSGIGRELAKVLSQNSYAVGLTGRREHLLASLQSELPGLSYIQRTDLSQPSESIEQLEGLAVQMGGLDLLIISAGTGVINSDLAWEGERDTINVNVSGFTAVASFGMRYFIKQGVGHLVAISSVAALRGSGAAPAYNASKAFVSNYVEGLRQKVSKLKLPIIVTDVKPGFVDTAMAKGEGLFWVAAPEKAARQIYNAICRQNSHVYVTRRWRVIGWVLKIMPASLYNRM
ncbi:MULTISPECIES: SDR family NAD(P)-dependent oxidoreductase [unclassified Bradyrhizobium]|uniref:SDR family NAD(P)-dependent oxidoreductase n=1 Tax=unclassified Bradyrhizobium TaxID=2631580 RepID=UPI0029162E8B|nr:MULTISPECIES: SDR family NAD(P)-dependent oxidoreductase [unclassified Bradyrhizobium]